MQRRQDHHRHEEDQEGRVDDADVAPVVVGVANDEVRAQDCQDARNDLLEGGDVALGCAQLG